MGCRMLKDVKAVLTYRNRNPFLSIFDMICDYVEELD